MDSFSATEPSNTPTTKAVSDKYPYKIVHRKRKD